MAKILITGANGFLGQHLAVNFYHDNYNIIATGKGNNRLPIKEIAYQSADLINKAATLRLLEEEMPDIIIHTAALSKPDECEADRKLCLQTNVEATMNLLEYSQAFFIYVSTDFVFGENGPHAEDAIPNPLNFYGQSKLMAENLVRQHANYHAIVRPVFIYGKVWEGLKPNFLYWVKNNLEQGKKIKVVSDQQRTPTYVNDIYNGIRAIADKKATGDFHLAGRDILSPYQMAVTTAEVLGLDQSLIENVTSETFPEPVKRAKRSGLLIEKARQQLGYEPISFKEGVRLTFS